MATNAALVKALMGTPTSANQAVSGASGIPAWMQSSYVPNSQEAGNGGSTLNTVGQQVFDPTQNLNFNSLTPQQLSALQSMGWTGGDPVIPGQGGNQDTGPTNATLSPQFLQWAQANGVTPSSTSNGNDANSLAFYGPNSTGPGNGAIGGVQNVNTGSDAWGMAAMGLGLGGIGLLGAGAGGAAAASGGGGLSSSDAAALYGDAGYGAGGGTVAAGSTPSVIGGSMGAANGAIVDPAYADSLQSSIGAAYDSGAAPLTYSDPAALSSAASGTGTGSFGAGSLGGSGTLGIGAPGTVGGISTGDLLSGASGLAGLGGSADTFSGSGNPYSPSPSSGSWLDQVGNLAKSTLLNPNGGLSGIGKGLVGLGATGLSSAITGGGNTGLLNNVNYQQAATATGQSQRTNQTNAQGSLTYNQTGTDAQGNPTYTQNVGLNAPYQANLNSALSNQGGALGNLGKYNAGLPAAYAGAPSLYGNAGSQAGLVKQAQDAAYNSQTSYLDPQYAQLQKQLSAQLANQGVTYGSDAYNAAMTQFGSQQNQAYGTARDSAIAQGDNYANTLFNQNLQANSQYNTNLNNQGTNYLNQSGSALNGVVQNPTFASTPTLPTNYLGAAQLQGNANLNQYNGQIGNTNNLTNGLTNIGTSLAGNSNFWSGLSNLFGGTGSGGG